MNEPDTASRVAEDIKAGMERGKIVTADEAAPNRATNAFSSTKKR